MTFHIEMVSPVVNREAQCIVQCWEFQSMEEHLKNKVLECFSVHLVLTTTLMLLLHVEQNM